MSIRDKINLEKIVKIVDSQGWPSRKNVGDQGIQAAFLVIQHADLVTQEKYLPMMQQASQKGDLSPEALAMLQDRILIGRNKKQLYGSQIGQNRTTGSFYVLPLEAPEDVDRRRSEIGLPSMKEYVSRWGIEWSLESYEKGLQQRFQFSHKCII